MNENTKLTCFSYNKKVYPAGTKLVYNGACILNKQNIYLTNTIVTFLYSNGGNSYFKDDNNIYMCNWKMFEHNIVQIITDENKANLKETKDEFYWTDVDVTKTLWYILIMLFAIILHDCIGIWILATIIWYRSVFCKKK
jgi:hypothetical protein